LREDGFKENLVIGRDFMENHGITVVTEPLSKPGKDNLSWTHLVALAMSWKIRLPAIHRHSQTLK